MLLLMERVSYLPFGAFFGTFTLFLPPSLIRATAGQVLAPVFVIPQAKATIQ
jgi:hypothetical protein